MFVKNSLDALEKEWRSGVLLNPFEVINKAAKDTNPFKTKKNLQYTLTICEVVAELFLDCTNYLASHQDENIRKIEKNFLTALLLYIQDDAPVDEHSLCMVCELICADNPLDSETHQSDLDRLFNLLEEKNDKHPALIQYKMYQKSGSTRKLAFRSIKRRFRPLISITSAYENSIFAECSEFELLELAAALLHNCGDSPEEPQKIYHMVDEIIFLTVALASIMWDLDVTEQTSDKLFEILKNPEIYAPKITLTLKTIPADAFPELQSVFTYWHGHSEGVILTGNFKKAKLKVIAKFFEEYK